MELRHLRYFVAVAEEANFTAAARRLRVAQPALSQQIRHLEDEIGTPLFLRNQRPLRLSASGEVFLQSSRRILSEANQATRAAQRAAKGEVGRLTLGFVCLATSSILTKLVRDYRQKFPGIDLTLREMTPTSQVKALVSGEIHLGYTRRFDEIFHDRYLVAVPERHPLAKSKSVSLSQLETENFIIFKRPDTPSFYNQVFSACLKAGFSPTVVSEPDLLQTILILVDAEVGISIVPSCVADMKHTGVTLLPLAERMEPNPVVLVWSKNEECPSLKSFIDLARGQAGKLEGKILPAKWSQYAMTKSGR
jgi:DNA-binding transcriptional LysR family regulator